MFACFKGCALDGHTFAAQAVADGWEKVLRDQWINVDQIPIKAIVV